MTIDRLLTGKKFVFPNHPILFLLAGFFLTVTTVCPQTATAQTAGYEKWLGSYTFDDRAQAPKRRSSLDVVPFVTYDINVEAGADGKPTATFSENGVQRFQAFECSVAATGDEIEFYYEKFGAPGIKDTSKFKPGDLLFTLVETKIGKQTKYLFQPAAYKLVRYVKAKQKQPVYFQKQTLLSTKNLSPVN